MHLLIQKMYDKIHSLEDLLTLLYFTLCPTKCKCSPSFFPLPNTSRIGIHSHLSASILHKREVDVPDQRTNIDPNNPQLYGHQAIVYSTYWEPTAQ